MISHDRDFMDELVESVYDIDNEELVEYRGNYSDFLQQRTCASSSFRRPTATSRRK